MDIRNKSFLSPEFFEREDDLVDFAMEFAQHRFRFVYGNKDAWLLEASRYVEDFFPKPKEKEAMMAWIERAKDQVGFLPSPIRSVNELGYTEEEVASLIEKDSRCCEFSIKSALSSSQSLDSWENVKLNLRMISHNPKRYRGGLADTISILTPLLLNCNECWLLDPYFDIFRQDKKDTLQFEKLISAINQVVTGTRKRRTINVIGRIRKSEEVLAEFDNIHTQWHEFIQLSQVNAISLRLILLTEKYERRRRADYWLHDRHLWTNKVLADFSKGFLTERTKNSSYSFTIHNHDDHKEFQKTVIENIDNTLRNERFSGSKTIYELNIN